MRGRDDQPWGKRAMGEKVVAGQGGDSKGKARQEKGGPMFEKGPIKGFKGGVLRIPPD